MKKTIPIMGEILDDGQFRGHARETPDMEIENGVKIGRYVLLEHDEDTFYIFMDTGEVGAFKKADFEAHVAAFFGLNF